MATNNLLNQPAPAYRKFVDNQVLTDDQLNSVLDHLNYEDELSRVLLSGVGIVCGLQISYDGAENKIHITKGAAVTTAGNLIRVDATDYAGFKKFSDPNVKYAPFTAGDDSTIGLWQLEPDTASSDVFSLNQFETKTDVPIDEAIAVLYLEDYLREEEDCSPVDCNTQGREVVNTVRVLLVSLADVKNLAKNDSIFANLLSGSQQELLPATYAPRVILSAANTADYTHFKGAYAAQFNTIAGQITALSNINLFKNTFEKADVNPPEILQNLSASAINIQYLYDLYCDLVTAYNELRKQLKASYALCCPDPAAFSKHVLLGGFTSDLKEWRHRFYPSPILDRPGSVRNLQNRFLKLLLMVKDFKTSVKNEIVITPSRKNGSLGRRAIPFYYDLESAADPGLFYQSWKEADAEWVPNYYRYQNKADPLAIRLDDHDFYRIEGHVGHNITDAHKQIQAIQQEKGLSFDVIPVAIGGDPDEATIDYDKYQVYFEDLQVILQAWNEEQQCMLQSASQFFTRFSLKDPGIHLSYIPAETEETNANNTFIPLEIKPLEMPLYLYGTSTKEPVKKENYVLKGITEEQDTLGAKIIKNIDTSYNKSEIIYNTSKVLENTVKNWDEAIKIATVDIPLDLIGQLKETEDYKLTNIEDFTEENLKKYINALETQCKEVRNAKKRFQNLASLRVNDKTKAWIEPYEYTLNRIISSCCLIKKVQVLYEKILERKSEILEQLVLKNFITKHAGAEHKAGVEHGGTFVLLYYSSILKKEENRLSFLTENAPAALRGERLISGLPPVEVSERIARNFSRRGPIRETIPHGTVIGDLCLPYICSSTPSTTFVFPEQLATLRLPTDHICIDKEGNAEPVAMDVKPADGDIKAFINERELEGVITHKDNGIFFDPNAVSEENYGQPMHFEVNSQPVEPILTLYRKPRAGFTYSPDISFKKDNTIAVVTLKNTSEPFNDLSFEWNFEGQTEENQNALEFIHIFEVKPGQNYDFQVQLTAANGPCADTFSDSVNIDVPALDQPDQPEPDSNCLDTTTKLIKNSSQILQRDLGAHPDVLEAYHTVFNQTVKPVYDSIFEKPKEAFAGKLDSNIFPVIVNVQSSIRQDELFSGDDANSNETMVIQQEFALRLYYELMLLYFYLQACRDGKIGEDDPELISSGAKGDWPGFTKTVTEHFKKALGSLLDQDKINNKLKQINDQMRARFTEDIARIVDEVLRMLGDFRNG